jgi:MGT family glycosyltransferase
VTRVLFVVPPLVGHVNPTVAVGAALQDAGHEVAWAGHPDLVDPLLAPGSELLAVSDRVPPDIAAKVAADGVGLRGPAALKFLWQDLLIPLADEMLPGVERAVARFRPDVVVTDQQALAGAAVAERNAIPWATSATTSAELVDPLAMLPKVAEWVRELITGFLGRAGLPADAAATLDPRFSDRLVLAFSTPALVGRDRTFPDHWAFVGPSIGSRPADVDFPWDWLRDDMPLVLISLGTLNHAAGERFFRVAADAIIGLQVQAVMVAPPHLIDQPPPNLLVRARVPQLALLPRTAAVVSHCGHNTVCEALAHGLPIVAAPIRDDQPMIADQVVAAGAGVRVRFGRVRPELLADAVDAVLTDPRYAEGARTVAASFAAAGGPEEAARRVVALAPTTATPVHAPATGERP